MNNLDIPILQKIYELYKLFYQYAEKFPKKDRFTIGQRCENHILVLLENIIYASKSSKDNKPRLLFEISVKLDALKILIRLLKDVKTVDLKQYAHLEEYVVEIGKMLGGWIKSLH